ncbi:hypothetical protein [Devosia rhizoryzae]|uniref:Uncharacterized protein n=1 Tax=Devosia rhizoryzae TaxID=2774137 RepID=A0ABX7C7Y3_9HYPH|nr:hypothetical protein [Devosia rhizoryzae]QQR38066.1 hypothetical protein JI748_09675 [Devosia rhizoryzae]
MRPLFAVLLMTLAISTAHSQEAAGMSCASIIANAAKGGAETQIAIGTYFHGTFFGEPCVEVDYDRAYALAQSAGISFEPFANILRSRAAGGHPTAVAAVKRLGL